MDVYGTEKSSFIDPSLTANQFGITKGMKIADFGVGRGFYALILGELVGEIGVVSCIDVIQGALDHLKSMAQNKNLNQLRYIRANLEKLGGTGLADNSQDFVLMANILFQSQMKQDIMREAIRILKPGGRACIIDWKKGSSDFGVPDNLRTSSDEMRKMTEQVGLKFLSSIDAGSYHYGLMFIK